MPKRKMEKDALEQIVDQLDLSGITQEEMFGPDGLIKALSARILNKALEVEMDEHLGYKKHERKPKDSQLDGNSRNGYYTKNVLTSDQEVQITVPRDRQGEVRACDSQETRQANPAI